MSQGGKLGRIGVTPVGYDDIGAILEGLGEGFGYTGLDWDDLKKPSIVSEFDVLFLNCASEIPAASGALRDNLRGFVGKGGTLYASDWAGDVIGEAMPGRLELERTGTEDEVEACVVDPGISEFLGRTVKLTFDLPGWNVVNRAAQGVRILVAGDVNTDEEEVRGSPLLVSFREEKGEVLYTAFHNHEQTEQCEEGIIRHLAIRPVLMGVARAAAEESRRANFDVGKEVYATVNRGVPLELSGHRSTGPCSLRFVLAWQGDASMELHIQPPGQSSPQVHRAGHSPLIVEASSRSGGDWRCAILPRFVSAPNFPVVLTVCRRSS